MESMVSLRSTCYGGCGAPLNFMSLTCKCQYCGNVWVATDDGIKRQIEQNAIDDEEVRRYAELLHAWELLYGNPPANTSRKGQVIRIVEGICGKKTLDAIRRLGEEMSEDELLVTLRHLHDCGYCPGADVEPLVTAQLVDDFTANPSEREYGKLTPMGERVLEYLRTQKCLARVSR